MYPHPETFIDLERSHIHSRAERVIVPSRNLYGLRSEGDAEDSRPRHTVPLLAGTVVAGRVLELEVRTGARRPLL